MDCEQCGKPMVKAGIDYQKGGDKQRWLCNHCQIVRNAREYIGKEDEA